MGKRNKGQRKKGEKVREGRRGTKEQGNRGEMGKNKKQKGYILL
jgi:hypothetical protein